MSNQYDKYLKEHIQSVRKAAQWMLKNLSIANDLDASEVDEIKINVWNHDASKYASEEYDAYDAYFYGEKDEDAFNLAWLHHIHANPHHWQHWLLVNDDGKHRNHDKVIALEMPKVYALEMVADWWSFSWRSGNLHEVFGWYEEHRDVIILHPKTREFVEAVLGEISELVCNGAIG